LRACRLYSIHTIPFSSLRPLLRLRRSTPFTFGHPLSPPSPVFISQHGRCCNLPPCLPCLPSIGLFSGKTLRATARPRMEDRHRRDPQNPTRLLPPPGLCPRHQPQAEHHVPALIGSDTPNLPPHPRTNLLYEPPPRALARTLIRPYASDFSSSIVRHSLSCPQQQGPGTRPPFSYCID